MPSKYTILNCPKYNASYFSVFLTWVNENSKKGSVKKWLKFTYFNETMPLLTGIP